MKTFLYHLSQDRNTGKWSITSEELMVVTHESGLSQRQASERRLELNVLASLLPGITPERIFALYSEAKPLI